MMGKNNIKKLRQDNDLSQEVFAELFGITQSSITKWEAGTNNPSMEKAILIATYFDVSLDYLMGLTDEKRTHFLANNIRDSQFVQGNGSVTVNGENNTQKEISDLIRVYRESDMRGKAKLFTLLAELDEENKKREIL